MSHTPTTYLIGSTECRGFYAYPTVWLLSSGIMQQLTMLVNFPSTSWVLLPSPIIVHGVISSLTMQWTCHKYVSFSLSKTAQGTSVQRRDRGPLT